MRIDEQEPSDEPRAPADRAHDLLPIWQALAQIADPCQHACGYDLSIVDLGIVNAVAAHDGVVTVSLTFTEPTCLFGFRIVHEIEDRVAQLPGVRQVIVSLDAYPLWEPSRLTDRAREAHASSRLRFGPGRSSGEARVHLSGLSRGTRHV